MVRQQAAPGTVLLTSAQRALTRQSSDSVRCPQQVTNHANASALWSLQAQLTPIPLFQTMQEMAVACNAIAARWVRDLWWRDVNVVFCDFITGGDLVPTLIECNRQRH